jgi:5-hydroxyisourate hydrolase
MISTHVIDMATGLPAAGMTVILEMRQASEWTPIGRGETNAGGRVTDLLDDRVIAPGTYRLTFDTGAFQRDQGMSVPFFAEVTLTFAIRDPAEHYHVPLLLSPYGYCSYRG